MFRFFQIFLQRYFLLQRLKVGEIDLRCFPILRLTPSREEEEAAKTKINSKQTRFSLPTKLEDGGANPDSGSALPRLEAVERHLRGHDEAD